MAKLSSLIVGQKMTIASGASRGIGASAKTSSQPHLSFIDATTPGEKCALSNRPELWRSDHSKTQSLTLQETAGHTETLTWPAGKSRIDIPQALVFDGARITARLAGRSVVFRLNLQSDKASNTTETFAWMIDQGCRAQAVALLQALRTKTKWQ